MKITIIGANNNGGLEKDKIILTKLLQEHNFDVDARDNRDFAPLSEDTDLCIHLEVVDERCFGKRNILIPNQEWFMRKWLPSLHKFEAIFCKSRYAYNIFNNYHNNVHYTGFTSIDCYVPSEKAKECFHAAGNSKAKGTQLLIYAWDNFTDARLHLATRTIDTATITNESISAHYYLSKEEYSRLRNSTLIHIYPSQVEGFGHCINEAMSCGAVVITTDYPPMNEFKCNFYIPAQVEYTLPNSLGSGVYIDPASIRKTVEEVLARNDLHELGKRSREYFLQSDKEFRERFMSLFNTLKI
ncbi:Glycosyl transferases group 1 [Chitinophaga sp. YR573]|uniref:glycosyltransferase n=1 Tax=Chitinophaga sp. YR573 TaxID=1881040 RepID=UPI0008C51A7A|nr:glycosyltransferase [Chitinophaga sp. YR573]SEW17869.1 Glycosyl transferases group 1 [Chitinophaga sp. YR573]